MRNNPKFKANLATSTKAIKSLIGTTHSNILDVIDVTLEDWDITEQGLHMVLIGIEIKMYSEPEIHEMAKQIQYVSDKLDSTLSMIGFSNEGTITNPKNSKVEFSESGMIRNIQYNPDDESLEIVVDYMFWNGE